MQGMHDYWPAYRPTGCWARSSCWATPELHWASWRRWKAAAAARWVVMRRHIVEWPANSSTERSTATQQDSTSRTAVSGHTHTMKFHAKKSKSSRGYHQGRSDGDISVLYPPKIRPSKLFM